MLPYEPPEYGEQTIEWSTQHETNGIECIWGRSRQWKGDMARGQNKADTRQEGTQPSRT
jgi:hypothetical protein